MKRLFKNLILLTLTLVFILPSLKTNAAVTKNVTATQAYTISGLNHNLNVQNFYIGSSYLYVTQRKDSTTYLSRCMLNGNTATYMDEMILTNCGHGQTLEYMEYNKSPYFLVGCKSDSSDMNWSLQIGVIQYEAGKQVDYTQMKRFGYLNYANKTATSVGTTKRVAAATAQDNNRIIFRVANTNNEISYSIYDRNKLFKMLLNSSELVLDMRTAKSACLSSFTQKGSSRVWSDDNSFQGIEMKGTSKIYVSGGAEGNQAQILRMNTKGTLLAKANIMMPQVKYGISKPEIEGLQSKTVNGQSRLYFVIPYHNNSLAKPKVNTQEIYYIKESSF